jgi:glycogen debranching enzyme
VIAPLAEALPHPPREEIAPMVSSQAPTNLSADTQQFLAEGHTQAIEVIRRNLTTAGFTACSVEDNRFHGTEQNYRAVWARDGALTVLWTLALDDPDIRQGQVRTLETLFEKQARNGQIPASVSIDTGKPEYEGVGGIASIDSVLWLIIAAYDFAEVTGDWSVIDRHAPQIDKAMQWLEAHDSNNCGLIEIPEAGDWTDLFARSYHVLYDEVLWQRCLGCYSRICEHLGRPQDAVFYEDFADLVRRKLISGFWPTTDGNGHDENGEYGREFSFTQAQYSLGDARYFVAQLSPFSFSWRCDVYANILAYLTGMVDHDHAMMSFRFLWGAGVNEPGPVKNLYPPVQTGDPEWRDYFAVNMLNLPDHYHNGGIWPFIGGMWVRYVHKLGMTDLAQQELVKLAHLCREGLLVSWEFNEWHHGQTGRPMGKRYQAWSAASFIQACHDLSLAPDSKPRGSRI